MAKPITAIGGVLTSNSLNANMDALYGPYDTVADAVNAIGERRLSAPCSGLTVGIKNQTTGKVTEYWVQPKGTTPGTYGLVEKGTTDYNDLDNKPTIGDGTNTALPIVGNVKVTASTALGETAGVTVTPGQTTGEIEINFTLPKGNDGQDGAPGAPGHNPNLGTFLDTDTDKPTVGQTGDYFIVIDTSVTPRTANVYAWNGTAFADTGKSVEDFGLQFTSGQAVNTVGIDNEPTAGSGNIVKSGGVADLSGAFIMEANIPQTSSIIRFSPTIKVDRAPIEITIDVVSNTASFEDSSWLGIVVKKQGAAEHFNNLVEDNGKFYFKETSKTYIESTEFVIYARKCTVAGTLKIRVNTNNGKATLVKRIGEIESSISTIGNTVGQIGDNIEQTSQEVDLIKEVMPIKQSGWEKKEDGVYTLINIPENTGTRLRNGKVLPSSISNSRITDWIQIQEGKRVKLRTLVDKFFDGVAYYSSNDENSYLGNDVFHSETEITIENELTIPANATYMRLATKDKNIAYEVYEYVEEKYLSVASEKYVQEQLEEYTPSTEYINDLIDEKNEPIEEDIDYLYGVVSAGSTPPELAVRYVPTIQLFLGSDILNISNVDYDSNYWTIENNLPKYLGGTGGGQSKSFKFTTATRSGIRYLCDMVTFVQQTGGVDDPYVNLFYLRIGSGPLINTYNGSGTTFGGLVSDGGYFEIVPYGTKAFDVTAITLKPVVNSNSDPDYTETKTLTVENVDAGNSARTLLDGKWNVAVGPTGLTMSRNISGSRSVAVGFKALYLWKYGMQNIALGSFALASLEEGNHNVAIGSDCMYHCKKAQDNVAIGQKALGKTGEYAEMLNNVAIGALSMCSQQSSSRDSVSIGYNSNTYGAAYSVFIGSNCTTTQANQSITNAIAIGYNAKATKSNQCVLGNASVSEFVLGNKKLIFNQDGTVSWETVS